MRDKIIKYSGILISILTLIILVISFLNYAYFEKQLKTSVIEYGLVAIFLFALFLEFLPQYISVHLVLVTAFLLGFDPILATLMTLIGSMYGSALGYAVGRDFGSKFTKSLVGEEKYNAIEESVNKKGRWFVFLTVLTPLPYFPMIFGAARLSKRNFLLFGIIPRILDIIVTAVVLYLII